MSLDGSDTGMLNSHFNNIENDLENINDKLTVVHEILDTISHILEKPRAKETSFGEAANNSKPYDNAFSSNQNIIIEQNKQIIEIGSKILNEIKRRNDLDEKRLAGQKQPQQTQNAQKTNQPLASQTQNETRQTQMTPEQVFVVKVLTTNIKKQNGYIIVERQELLSDKSMRTVQTRVNEKDLERTK